MLLEDFLFTKPLYYERIDYTRMPRVYSRVKTFLNIPKIIHLVGTNGKGTTGRFLATALYALGFKTMHYTSPHILKFNERIWINGRDADDKLLQDAHLNLQNILTPSESNELSYFEYTTLLCLVAYQECEYLVMEAGLGGEYDATAVFDKILTLVTPISFDHEAFLGSSIKEIASTKLNSIQNNAILAKQIEEEVYEVATLIAKEKNLNIKNYNELLYDNDKEKINKIAKSLKLENYLIENLSLCISALNFLNIKYRESNFLNSKLFGRFTYVKENVIVDVGHNPLAAKAIKDALIPDKFILVYNSYKDKDYKKILQILKPIIKSVQIIAINEQRVASNEQLKKTLKDLEIQYCSFEEITQDEKYLVFGSFSVVEAFMNINKRA
ncbi:bifunctional folylpolyglutamate synthase/dihydrofolate synthase [Sulfurimonas sp.]|uniref:bifunctional folylpolyglutamate synthase/dihydrofolate synthase n=1 Tax=Sulfurimonas sp. TaxID=2022749 RepID=UPI002AB03956|nr:bifunctional folylpolyglutamate synthase/dihydrofolate synthase [Sulfurimonas sp.]